MSVFNRPFCFCSGNIQFPVGFGGGERGVPPERRQEDADPVPRAQPAALHDRHPAEGGVGRPEGALRGRPARHGPHPPAAGRAPGHQGGLRGQREASAKTQQAAVRRR